MIELGKSKTKINTHTFLTVLRKSLETKPCYMPLSLFWIAMLNITSTRYLRYAPLHLRGFRMYVYKFVKIRKVFIVARQPAYLRDIYRMYASMTHGNSMRDLCQRLNPQNLRINERRLVQFGLIEGLIRRVNKYPIYLPGSPCNEEAKNPVYKYFTGTYSLDEICCSTGQSAAQIEDHVERDPNVVTLWK